MRNYATAQLMGDRSAQCDATAVSTAPSGSRAYVLLDGIGTSDEVRDPDGAVETAVASHCAERSPMSWAVA